MGGKQAISIPNSFFGESDQEILRAKFIDFNNQIDLFPLPSHPDFSIKLRNYISSHLKSKKDFKSFVGILECLIYGKSTNILIRNTSSLSILIEILSESVDSLAHTLPILLLSLCEIHSSITDHISPPASDPKKLENYLSIRFPILASSFSRFIRSRLFKTDIPKIPSVPIQGRLIDQVLNLLYFSSITLATASSALHRIYLSDIDGLSFNRLAAGMAGYDGSMILVIKVRGDIILGAYIGENLKDNAMISGSMDTFLYTLDGGFRTLKPEFGAGGGKYVYFNSKLAKSIKFPKGLGFGGEKEEARMWIDNEIEDSFITDSCQTYENGSLLVEGGRQKLVIYQVEISGT